MINACDYCKGKLPKDFVAINNSDNMPILWVCHECAKKHFGIIGVGYCWICNQSTNLYKKTNLVDIRCHEHKDIRLIMIDKITNNTWTIKELSNHDNMPGFTRAYTSQLGIYYKAIGTMTINSDGSYIIEPTCSDKAKGLLTAEGCDMYNALDMFLGHLKWIWLNKDV